MILKASRQHLQAVRNSRDHVPRDHVPRDYVSRNSIFHEAYKAGKESYDHCGSTTHFTNKCYIKNPKIALEWFKLKMKE